MSRKFSRIAAAFYLLTLSSAGVIFDSASAQSELPDASAFGSPKDAEATAKTQRATELARITGMFNALQADPALAPRVPAPALAAAKEALSRASGAANDTDSGAYLLYIADRKVQLALALAQTAYAQEQYQQLVAQRDRSPNANAGFTQITPTAIDTPQQEELQRGAAALHPSRDRGALHFFIDDVVVLPGTITLTRDTSNGLVALSVYLRRNPQSQLLLIGHSRGEVKDDAVQRTAQARADGVRNYLLRLGVQIEQITLDTKVSGEESQCMRCVDAYLDPPWATDKN